MSVSNWPGNIKKYFREVRLEMQKVSWPNRQSVIGSTAIVLIAVFFLSVYSWGLDYVWGRLLAAVLKLSSFS